MRTFFFSLAACAALLLAPEAHAQRGSAPEASGEVVEAWYEITSGDRVEMVRARTIERTTRQGRVTVQVDGRRLLTSSGAVGVVFHGVQPEEPTQAAQGTGSSAEPKLVSHTNIFITTGGGETTISAKNTTTDSGGNKTTTQTTTTTSGDGSATSITKTTKGKAN